MNAGAGGLATIIVVGDPANEIGLAAKEGVVAAAA
jgi:hypothetical protein